MADNRDNFSLATKERLAKRASYLCSNPDCRRSTVGAAMGHEGFISIGVAAHITAASPDGPRYDPSFTSEQRRHYSNGIWLCQDHGKLVDSDEPHFSVELLRSWKRTAEERSFAGLVGPSGEDAQSVEIAELEQAVRELSEQLGLPSEDDLSSVLSRSLHAATADLAAFTRLPGWPRHAVTLNLRVVEGENSRAFQVSGLAMAVEAFNELIVIAPPGTGKTTTLLQAVEAIASTGRAVPVFVSLGDWATQAERLLSSVVRRPAFRGLREEHLLLLAHQGRLVLALDGWNELDSNSKRRATAEIRELQRNFPRLGLIISTRREALDLPIGGQTVEVDVLNEDLQREIAVAWRGADGEALLDQAWRTPGVRELISIPLYLTALVAHTPGGTLPTTKEEILRLFVGQHEAGDKAASLHEALFGLHSQFLSALAVEGMQQGVTAIPVTQARAIVRRVEDRLTATGQMNGTLQPVVVLNVLTDQHMLVQSGADAFSFQHQQFQEWYASFEVERLMRVAATDGETALRALRVDILDRRRWEEPILFASERVSRADTGGVGVVAKTVLDALAIDPMLAADMIYRASSAVWEQVQGPVTAFVTRWHVPGTVDRAVRFMVITGRPEFGPWIWPLIESADNQTYLRALRSAPRFRVSVLGLEAPVRLRAIPDRSRHHVLAELAARSGMDGISLATEVAKSDPSIDVQVQVAAELAFRRADRFLAELLAAASPEVAPLLAGRGYLERIPEVAAALHVERQRFLDEPDPLRRLIVLTQMAMPTEDQVERVANAIAHPNFPAADQHASAALHEAFQHYPNGVATGLVRPLEAGLPVPYHVEDMLIGVQTIDEGPIARLAVTLDVPRNIDRAVASIVGPNTVVTLIDMLVDRIHRMKNATPQFRSAVADEYHVLRERVALTRTSSFIEAVLQHGRADRVELIGLLAGLVGAHGSEDARKRPLALESLRLQELMECVRRWVIIVLSVPNSARHVLADVAIAIGRIGHLDLVPDLGRLLAEDLMRWRRVREAFRAAPGRASIEVRSDASTSWTNSYRQAFSGMDGQPVIQVMGDYLENEDFGFDAACVLKVAWDRSQKAPEPDAFTRWPDFSSVARRRAERQVSGIGSTSPLADMIFGAIEHLFRPGSTENQQRLAIMLGRIGVAIPHGDRSTAVQSLINLNLPIRSKRELLTTIILDGEIIDAGLILEGIGACMDEVGRHGWIQHQDLWEVQGWLELMPFSSRPAATIDGVQLIYGNLQHRHELQKGVDAFVWAPDPECDNILAEMVRRFPTLVRECSPSAPMAQI